MYNKETKVSDQLHLGNLGIGFEEGPLSSIYFSAEELKIMTAEEVKELDDYIERAELERAKLLGKDSELNEFNMSKGSK